VNGAVKLEEHVAGVVDPVRTELADGALRGVRRLARDKSQGTKRCLESTYEVVRLRL
jgi:hypothetical protein